jgi:hypothetical protein
MFAVPHKHSEYNPPLPPLSGWSGGTLDNPWTYPGTIDHPPTPCFNQASLSEQHSRDYNADLFVDNRLIIELKAAKAVADEHVAQLLGYLRASRIEHGLLINFGAPKLEIRKFALSQPGRRIGAGGVASFLVSVLATFAPFRGLLHSGF